MASADEVEQPGDRSFFGCAYCHEAFPDKRELEVHQKMIHVGLPFFSKPAPMPEREWAPVSAISKNMPLSEVTRHCIPEDCWVAINGKIYDVTEFADRHPGGPTVLLSHAGKDASKIYNDIHKGVKIENYLRPEALLGDLGVDEQLMSEQFWHTLRKARIEEVKVELDRLRSGDELSGAPLPRKHSSIDFLLQHKDLDRQLKAQLQSLETQKRAALDAEDFGKAQEIKATADSLLAAANIPKPTREEMSSTAGIPLSEVARHNKPHDCWVAFNGTVYDLTDMMLHHPEQRKAVLAWAGREASSMWNKIPGRFPSSTWMEFFMRPEARMGNVGPEPPVDPKAEQIRRMEAELHRLEGPSDEEIQAAHAPRSAGDARVSQLSEEARFPRLAAISAGKQLPLFTRAEVAKHKGPSGGPPGSEPWIILHNKVYDLTSLLGSHPGGDDVLLARAGTDATRDFEVFEHSEKSRVRRDQDLLVGELIPAECTDWAAEAAGATAGADAAGGVAGSELARYLRYKAADAAMIFICWYAYWSYQKRNPLPKLMYSRGLRHLHFIMAVGIFGSLGSAQAASRSEGLAKKRWLAIHKQTGVAMLLALVVRAFLRLSSGMPPRFPGHPVMKAIETQSLRVFYLLLLVITVSGMANEYFLKWAEGDEKENGERAKQAITLHTKVGRFFQNVWLPFHLGYTTSYHYSRGRRVVRKVSPFI
eukprot:CAMPEP_0203868110 /NCGR_PEP_ID=MMETSP0359-20131031/16919_1 /ASSEMBLY_ACC=CAM_ASM_000338 /TAXON_ID=268821 /ORGANISM="Scrippsiella Hangoei, Strain SHTV-5" /LENGTH=704 /DNA_ID=CAMNT_0050786473 /DNA_START=52 /DNA_END=2166 /DNA_ORIENTATION=-